MSAPAKISFLVNSWKTLAENPSPRWKLSSNEEMVELQRAAATVEQMKKYIPTIKLRETAEKAAEANGGTMPASIPEHIATLRVLGAISAGFGSAAAMYSTKDKVLEVTMLVAKTQGEGQYEAQKSVVTKLLADAKQEGILQVLLSAEAAATLFGAVEDFGFKQLAVGEKSSMHEDFA